MVVIEGMNLSGHPWIINKILCINYYINKNKARIIVKKYFLSNFTGTFYIGEEFNFTPSKKLISTY